MRIFLAIKVFFKTLFQRDFSKQIEDYPTLLRRLQELEKTHSDDETRHRLEIEQIRKAPGQGHGEFDEGACALLSLLQKEARFIDFLMENVGELEDAQVGAVCKRIHKDLSRVTGQFLGIEAVCGSAEGECVQIEEGYSPAEFQLSGDLDQKPPFEAVLKHKGWRVQSLTLPKRPRADQGKILQPALVHVS
jgi:hypothetical protein